MTKQFTTQVGRLVGGDVLIGRSVDFEGRPLTTKDGKPREDYYIAVAYPKDTPATNDLLCDIRDEAAAEFRHGETQRPDFAWKLTDGDSTVPNMRGRKPCENEGYPGHWVVRFSSGFAPKLYDAENREITDPARCRRGYYVRVAGQVRANGSSTKPGLYVSHALVQLVAHGEEIHTGPDAAVVFGAPPASLPAGASRTPIASAPMPSLPLPTPPLPPPPPPPPAAARQMAPGCIYTYDQLASQGWTDAQMRSQGWLA